MAKSEEAVIHLLEMGLARFRDQPPLGPESVRIREHLWIAVQHPRIHADLRTRLDGVCSDGRAARGYDPPEQHADRWMQTHCLADDSLQVGQLVRLGKADWDREVFLYLEKQLGLHIWVLQEMRENRPHGNGGGIAASGDVAPGMSVEFAVVDGFWISFLVEHQALQEGHRSIFGEVELGFVGLVFSQKEHVGLAFVGAEEESRDGGVAEEVGMAPGYLAKL